MCEFARVCPGAARISVCYVEVGFSDIAIGTGEDMRGHSAQVYASLAMYFASHAHASVHMLKDKPK